MVSCPVPLAATASPGRFPVKGLIGSSDGERPDPGKPSSSLLSGGHFRPGRRSSPARANPDTHPPTRASWGRTTGRSPPAPARGLDARPGRAPRSCGECEPLERRRRPPAPAPPSAQVNYFAGQEIAGVTAARMPALRRRKSRRCPAVIRGLALARLPYRRCRAPSPRPHQEVRQDASRFE